MDETDEQFEERVLNKRAYQMFTVVRSKLQNANQITFSEMCHRNSRKQVFNLFGNLLLHHTHVHIVLGCPEVLQSTSVKKVSCFGTRTRGSL